MYSCECWNIQLSIPSKCYFPQIVWFTVNEFSLPIIIWWSFRSPPDIGHCCRKHERKYLEISACSSGGRRPRYPPQPREWRKLSIDKRDFELRERPLLFWMESCLWKIAFIINSYFHAGRWKMAVALFVSDGNKVICILKCKPWPHSMCDILYIFNSLLVETSSQQNIILLEFLVWEVSSGQSIIFRLVGRTNLTPEARGINQTGLHKFPNRGKTNRENRKSITEEKTENISYLMLQIGVSCCRGRGGPWKYISMSYMIIRRRAIQLECLFLCLFVLLKD